MGVWTVSGDFQEVATTTWYWEKIVLEGFPGKG